MNAELQQVDLRREFEQLVRRHGIQPDTEWVDFAGLLSAHYTPPETGRHSIIADKETVALLLHHLAQCNHRVTACKLAGISQVTFNALLKRGEAGETPFNAFCWAIEKAEGTAENEARRCILDAGKDPRFWAAPMTWLERKDPERFGRRNEDSSSPKVIVQIGVKDSDVQVQIASISQTPTTLSPALSGDMHSLTDADTPRSV